MFDITIQNQNVPVLGLGTWQVEGDACREAVEHALSVGYRHIDTAQIYENEAEVGQGLQASDVRREDIFLVSKVWTSNFRHADTISSTHESLRKLRTDYVDLMLMHWPTEDENISHEETLQALVELQQAGSVRHIGVSNFSPAQVEEAAQYATIFCNQVEYHPRKSQRALVEQAQTMGYMLTAYSPLAQGDVIGDATLEEIGEAHGKSAAQVALRWLVQQQNVCTIPRSTSAKHRVANFEIFDFELSDDEMQAIYALAGA